MKREEAIEVVKKNYPHVNESGSQFETALRTLIPELKESEDERMVKFIKKQLFNIKKTITENYELDAKLTKAIDWLEKQDEHANFCNKIQIGDKVTRNEDGVLVNLSQLKRVAKKDEKQGKNNMGISEATKQKLEDNLNKALEKETPESWNEFFEKQGEQKHKIQPKFKIGDIIRFKGNETLKGEAKTHKIVRYDNELYVFDDGTTDLFCEQDLYELVDQKPADKVEPKFHEGDKIKLAKEPKYPAREIIANKNDAYYFDELVHLPFSRQDEWELVEQNPAAWSEEDKKMSRFIGNAITADDASIYLESKGIQVIDAHVWLYELKDRVQSRSKQEWNKEDEYNHNIILYLLNNECVGVADKRIAIEWFKALKERYTWKPSDEQIEALDFAADCIVPAEFCFKRKVLKELLEQLKKLKGE